MFTLSNKVLLSSGEGMYWVLSVVHYSYSVFGDHIVIVCVQFFSFRQW